MLEIRSFAHPKPRPASAHSHAEGQIFMLTRGACEVFANGRRWRVAARRPFWAPPHVPHNAEFHDPVAGVSVLIDAESCADLPAEPAMLARASLLLGLLDRLADLRDARRIATLGAVLCDEIRAAREDPLALPMPSSPPLRTLAEALAREPDLARGLDDWCRVLPISKRTLLRRFPAETGLTFVAWRQRARLARAVDLLAEGHGVTATALAVGYESASAFTTVFRAALGSTPSAYGRARL